MTRAYRHAEAWCVMRYMSDDGEEVEEIWNSRDGVTPYVITLRSGKEATHVDWRSDVPRPNYDPPPGSRVFVDLTAERAREKAQLIAERAFADEGAAGMLARERFGSPEVMAEALLEDFRPGMPDLVEVPAGGWVR